MGQEELLTAADAYNKAQDIVEGREAIAAKIEKAAAEGKFSVVGMPAPVVIDELRAKGYSCDDMTNFGKIQGYVISWKNGLTENIGSYEAGDNNFSDPDKQIVLNGTIPAKAKVNATGKAVTLKTLKADSSLITATATENVEITGSTIAGTYSDSNAMVIIHADKEVNIKNNTFSANGYNSIEIGLKSGYAEKITIANCDFSSTCSNNAINIFATADNCVVNIENCHFAKVSNMLRISNQTNVHCTINIKDCVVDAWETEEVEYTGAVLCQDSTTKGEGNLFGDGKIKINFFNLTGPNGVVKGVLPEDVCGTKNEKQLVYVYTDKVEEYAANVYPVVKVI